MAEREHKLTEVFESRRIVVTRPGASGEAFAKRLSELGAIVVHQPAITFAEPHDIEPFREAVHNIANFDWLLFTSANAVMAVSEQVLAVHGRLDILLPAIAAVGPTTAAAIRAIGWTVAFTPSRSGGMALADQLPAGSRSRVLLPRADIASSDLPNALREQNCAVHEVVAYRTLLNDAEPLPAFDDFGNVDALTFTSPSTVSTFVRRANAAGWNLGKQQLTAGLMIACIGETTASAVRQHNLKPDVVAAEQSMEGLIDAMAKEFRRRDQFDSPTSKYSRSF